ncbi:unnamed protein product [Symbiodinium natans]|uniref:Uncharacterized protein n=1 Tax=Symbiodinium natans TaxID=878477 RepID=A0A812I8S2_9DINO|nr:unnamed protein product [Symbiodinium natans]
MWIPILNSEGSLLKAGLSTVPPPKNMSMSEDAEAKSCEELLKECSSEPIIFVGNLDHTFTADAQVIVSFPGAYGKAWNYLTHQAQDSGNSILTTCIFLPDHHSEGYGHHVTTGAEGGVCHCSHLYGRRQVWGCAWYALWMEKTQKASTEKCNLIVVTKRDGSLGRSQQGEVNFLEVCGHVYCQMTIEDFVYFHHKEAPRRKQKVVQTHVKRLLRECQIQVEACADQIRRIRRAGGDSTTVAHSPSMSPFRAAWPIRSNLFQDDRSTASPTSPSSSTSSPFAMQRSDNLPVLPGFRDLRDDVPRIVDLRDRELEVDDPQLQAFVSMRIEVLKAEAFRRRRSRMRDE